MQVLTEPELDDRLQTHSMRNGTDDVGWNYSRAELSWRYYLGDATIPPPHAARHGQRTCRDARPRMSR